VTLPTIYGPPGVILALALSCFPYVFLIVQGALAAVNVLLTLLAMLTLGWANRKRNFVTVGGTSRTATRLATPGARAFGKIYCWVVIFIAILPQLVIALASFAARWPGTMLPGLVVGVAYLTAFNSGPLVLTGTAIIIVLAYFTRRVAFVFRSVSAAIAQIDPKLEDASKICGAGWGTTMRRVMVPLAAPAILAGAILVFSTLIGEISATVLLYSAKWKTISIASGTRPRSRPTEWPAAAVPAPQKSRPPRDPAMRRWRDVGRGARRCCRQTSRWRRRR